MKQATQSPSASASPTKTFEEAISLFDESTKTKSDRAEFQLYVFDHFTPTDCTPEQYTDIDDLVDAWDKDDNRREALEEARSWVNDTFHSQDGETVRTIRLRKGWSQSQLASELNTSQPHIYRIERGTENISIETCRKLSKALEIDMNSLDQMLRNQEIINQQKATSR